MLVKLSGFLVYTLFLLSLMPVVASAGQDESDVLAIADKAFERISAEDTVGLTDLMLEETVLFSTALHDGEYRVQARTYLDERGMTLDRDLEERGFNPVVMVSGPIAMVWYPYDFYLDGEWSHCGVDIFNLVRSNDGWRIASMTWSAEQPPDCEAHPDGPPVSP